MTRRIVASAAVLALVIVLAVVLIGRRGDRSQGAAGTGGGSAAASGASVGSAARDPNVRPGQLGVPARRVAGVVLNAAGAPVGKATIRLTSRAVPVRAPVTTGADGRFDLGPIAAIDDLVVSADAPGLTARVQQLNLGDPLLAPPPDALTLILYPCDASIHGTVLDSAGGAVGGAMIARASSLLSAGVGVVADASGAFELCVPMGDSGIVVSADGYATAYEALSVYGRTKRDIRLRAGATVGGRVVRAGDHAPVPSARVELRGDPGDSPTVMSTVTDADGRFVFESVAPVRLELVAEADGYASAEGLDVFPVVGTPVTDLECIVRPAYKVSGRVVERGTKTPLPGESVVLDGGGSLRGLFATTQADGSFTIAAVLPGEYIPTVRDLRRDVPDGEQATRIVVTNADVTGVVVEADRGGTIAGRVLSKGKPVDGAWVRAGVDGTARTDASGAFEMRGMPPGDHEMYAESQRLGAFTRGPVIKLAAGDRRTGVELELDLSASVSGTVVDQNNAPVAGVFVGFAQLGGGDVGSATTADDGSFTARALSGGGQYGYEVRPREHSDLVYKPVTGKRHPPVNVADGNTHVTGLRIRIRYEHLSIHGRVLDGAGKPVVDATVTSALVDEAWAPGPTDVSDESGAFTLEDVPPGSYRLRATALGGEGRSDNVEAGRRDVVIRMTAPGAIDGTLLGFSTAPQVRAFSNDEDDSYGSYTATVSGTTFHIGGVPAGKYLVLARTGDERETVTVVVQSGKTSNVTFDRTGGATVTGVVTDSTSHRPVPNVWCSAMPEPETGGGLRDSMKPTDSLGAFSIDNVRPGVNRVTCVAEHLMGSALVTVANTPVRVEITVAAEHTDDKPAKDPGMELDNKLGDVVVASVVPGGAAARAGFAPGDVIVSVAGTAIKRNDAEGAYMLLVTQDTSPVTVVIERADQPLTLSLAL